MITPVRSSLELRRSRRYGASVLIAALVAPLAAASLSGAQRRPSGAISTPAAGEVRVSLVRDKDQRGDAVVLVVRVAATGLALGSYQGKLQFDPSRMTIDSASSPRDGYRLVNADSARWGLVKFAGFTTTGFAGVDAVRIVARMKAPVAGARVDATLDVAGDVEGHKVPAAQLVPAHGISGS